jgi:hypothetical protein
MSTTGETERPIDGMTRVMLTPFILAVRECARRMMSNAQYVLNELPNVELGPALRQQTHDVWQQLIGTKHDLMTELHELAERAEDGLTPTEAERRVVRIARWTQEDLRGLHELVMALQAETDRDSKAVLASLLVTESATNLLDAFGPVRSSAEAVLRAVRSAGRAHEPKEET